MTKPIKEIFWYLPSGFRRRLAPIVMPERYKGFQKKLQPDAKERAGSTLKPFLDHRCIFVHIPKSAGLSVTNSLFGSITGSHIRLVEYQMMFSQAQFDQFFKFTFVRNPWDRAVSAFYYLKRGGMNESNRIWAEKNLSAYDNFESFAKGWLNKRSVFSHSHFRPQYQYVCLPGKRKPAVDFVCYFENLEADYAFVSAKLGIDMALQTKNITEGKSRNYHQYYSEETKQIVADAYRRDIELFGYDFDNQSVAKRLTERDAASRF